MLKTSPTMIVRAFTEDLPVLLSEFCLVQVNFPNADFWLIRVGTKEKVGMPVRTFHSERIGIKVIKTDLVFPDYLFYVFLNLHNQKHFEIYCAQGTLDLVYIKISQVKSLRFNLNPE